MVTTQRGHDGTETTSVPEGAGARGVALAIGSRWCARYPPLPRCTSRQPAGASSAGTPCWHSRASMVAGWCTVGGADSERTTGSPLGVPAHHVVLTVTLRWKEKGDTTELHY
jgi:hypothetical protein